MHAVRKYALRFLAWWFGALWECVPPGARRWAARTFLAEDPRMAAVIDRGEIRFYENAGKGRGLRLCGGEATDAPAGDDGKHKIIAAVPMARAMRRRIAFPAAAEHEIPSALAFEVEQVTPLKADEAYWDWRVADRDAHAKMIEIDLFAAPAWVVDEALNTAESSGLSPVRIDVADIDNARLYDVDLSRSLREFDFPRVNRRPAFIAAGLLFAIVTFASVAWFQNKAAERAELRLAAAQETAQPVMEMRAALLAAEQRLKLMQEIQASSASAAQLLDELARILPEDTWLFEVSARNLEVTIAGESEQASNLIKIVEASPRFTNARFSSALTRGAGDNTERFVLTFKIAEEQMS